MRRGIYLFIIFFLIACLSLKSQERGKYRILFYNVENLFDTIDNPETNDDEFIPQGDKHWNSYRYWRKINKIYQVIVAAGDQTPPEIIGLCEVEGFLPLYNLIQNTPLIKFPYTIIHNDSPDSRGIDVALLIRNDKIKLIEKEFLQVTLPNNSDFVTREILHASLQVEQDTLHVFVNHWPSRSGGETKSEPKRIRAAEVLTVAINLVIAKNPRAKIIALGDFNDEPENKSVLQLVENTSLVNLSAALHQSCNCGTYKYRSKWNMIDQVLVTTSLLSKHNLSTSYLDLNILDSKFLLIDDLSYGGEKPNRTYLGPRYVGGYSDHLPILLDLNFK
jgi:endonuclease/exonuclease/phosphatase family metal-dependent hydrolase